MEKPKEMSLQKKFWLLQVNDSLFPIGGYSHSYGLETYIQKGLADGGESAAGYIKNRIKYSLKYTELLAVRLAWERARAQDMEGLVKLETELEAARVPLEVREADRKLGNRFVKTVIQMPVVYENEGFQEFVYLRRGESISHFTAYGVFCHSIGIDIRETLLAYLYGQVSAMVTNCVKSIPLPQSEGQQILASMGGLMERTLEEVLVCDENMLCASAPGFDIRCIQHESLYSRIYMS